MKKSNTTINIINIIKQIFLIIIPLCGIINFYNKRIDKYSDLLFLPLFLLLEKSIKMEKNKTNKKEKIIKMVLAIIYSIMYVGGTIINIADTTNYSLLHIILYMFSFSVFFYFIVDIIIEFLSKIKIKKKKLIYKKRLFWITFILIIISYLPYLILGYPGLVSSDSLSQIYQAKGITNLSNHHPVAHTLIIRMCLLLSKDVTVGVSIYSCFQIIIMALIFSYTLTFILKESNSILLYVIGLLFYMLVPIFGLYSITMWKDVLFGAISLLLCVQTYKYIQQKELRIIDIILLVISVFATCILRNNGIYITLTLTIILIFSQKEKAKKTILLFLIPCTLCLIITGPIYKALDIRNSSFAESVGIPLSQISLVVKEDQKIDKETRVYLNKLIGIDEIKNNYNGCTIDSIKFNANFNHKYLENNKAKFFKIWLKLLVRYPKQFVKSYLSATRGFWYIEQKGYTAHFFKIANNEVGLKEQNPNNLKKLEDYFNKANNYPIIEYLLSPAFYFVVLLFSTIWIFNGSSRKYTIVLLIPLLLWITTMIATPICYQSRYVFTLYTTFPLVLCLYLTKKN